MSIARKNTFFWATWMMVFFLLLSSGPAQAQTLSQIGQEYPQISTLVTLALQTLQPQLQELQKEQKTITIFAPDNAAFQALPPSLLQYLKEHPTVLADVLLYHILPGTTTAQQLYGKGIIQAKTLFDNEYVTIDGMPTSITVNGKEVIKADIFFDLGVIHIINGVLVPPSFEQLFQQIEAIPPTIQPVVIKTFQPVVTKTVQPIVTKIFQPVVTKTVQPIVTKIFQPVVTKTVQPIVTKTVVQVVKKPY
ncbi:hypothetical protein CDCA_CDCA01G0223 [Cyanidium caldarium]|uniref:FAS1 domain-containing protein n=1 Tax=Cyanidium caldarium TaxID=2771 RepID=A0AAV9IQF4_CYACA|nr:hypothetical protein CDCA_CDCA01G0223 [Cyanidium caldarium]